MEQAHGADDDTQAVRIADLPEELLVMVFAHIDPRALMTAGQVCRYWRRIVSDERSWRRAFVRTFGRLPFERLEPSSTITSSSSSSSRWNSRTGTRRQDGFSWQTEYTRRVHLTKQWAGAGGERYSDEQRLEFNARVGSVDRVVVNEKHGWALAVSKAVRAAVRCNPSTGRVYARKNELKPVVFAMPQLGDDGANADDGSRVSAVAVRADRILWGLENGLCTATHLTRFGELKKRVVAARFHSAPVLDIAGPFDSLAQRTYDWRNSYGARAGSDLVASCSSSGSAHVWSDQSGQSYHFLHAAAGVPLVRVTWAEGTRYVVAASTAGVVFVWDLSVLDTDKQHGQNSQPAESQTPLEASEISNIFAKAPWLAPDRSEYSSGRVPPTFVFPFPSAKQAQMQPQRVVQLTGDPFGDSFVFAVEGRGVWRMGVDGTVVATFVTETPALPLSHMRQPPPITAAVWKVESGPKRRLPGISHAASRASPASATSAAASGTQTPTNGKMPDYSSGGGGGVLRLDLTKSASCTMRGQLPGEHTLNKRLLVVGDATGSLWMFDADDAGDAVQPLHKWLRIHQHAVSAIDVNAAVLVSAARDGQVLVIDPLSGRTLRTIRCHGGGRSLRRDLRRQHQRRRARNNEGEEEGDEEAQMMVGDVVADLLEWNRNHGPQNGRLEHRERRLDPRFWWVHLPLMNERTRADVYLAQMLASRTSEQWAIQTQNGGADSLDFLGRAVGAGDEVADFYAWMRVEPELTHGFPTLVADVVAGYAWVVVANGTRIHSCFLGHPQTQSKTKASGHLPHAGRLRAGRPETSPFHIAEEMAMLRLETHSKRSQRIEDHENRAYVEREFMNPTSELGLSPDEQIAYALWLSQQEHGGRSDSTPRGSPTGSDEVGSASNGDSSSLDASGLALEDMTEEEQVEYALFLSRTTP
ncbi:hypothetical protein IWW48_006056 [Coemansia sp. RSA 1200]|nr:hypothetical protein IWW48_006056 [Coemansia sp. RSA 1200]